MPLDENDWKELRAGLGITEGQKLSDVIAEQVKDGANAIVNAYDKRTKKDRDETTEALRGITEKLETLGQEPPKDPANPGDPPPPPDPPAPGALSPEVQKQIDGLIAANQELSTKVENSEKIAVAEREAREKAEAEREQQSLEDLIKTTAVTKEGGGFDPVMSPVLVKHLITEGLVRKAESGNGYEMKLSAPHKVTGEEQWAPIAQGLQDYSNTDLGKRFRPAVPGDSPAPSPDGTPRQPSDGALHLTEAQLQQMSSAEVEAAMSGPGIHIEQGG